MSTDIVPVNPSQTPITVSVPPQASPPSADADFIPGTRILYPSVVYRSYCASYTYRLSELIFGSLLAAYILGWINFAATTHIVESMRGLFISLTFCYLTAAYYLTYHSSVLTMPHLPDRALRFDFFIALFQAVLFGISTIWPQDFLVALGVSLLCVFARQQAVFMQLAACLEANTSSPSSKSEWTRESFFHSKVATVVESINEKSSYEKCLDGWLPVKGRKWLAAAALVAIGLVLIGWHYRTDSLPATIEWILSKISTTLVETAKHNPADVQVWAQLLLYCTIFIIVVISANDVFRRRANHVYKDIRKDSMEPRKLKLLLDIAAEKIVEDLKHPHEGTPE